MDLPQYDQLVLLTLVLVTTIFAHWLCYSQTQSSSDKTHLSKPTIRQKTFRVSNVPLDWNKDRLQSFLTEQGDITGPAVESLAVDIDGRCSTGTVTFQNILKQHQNDRSWEIPLQRPPGSQSARDRCLVLDDAFLGITPLFDPQPEDHKVDIIAISGLGGHAFGSFKERDGDYMWLRDSLPYDLTREDTLNPMARVMVYGYESCVANSNSFQNLEDLATSFHNSLLALAHTPTTRPIIFIAHSLGGLIIKETLITLSKSKNEDNLKLAKAVYGIVFFGVPHDGMDISSLIPMVENGPNRFLVESINRINSQILSIQRREFHTALGGEGDSEIICFYETEESRTAQKDKHGNWTMRGPRACLVTKSSATRCRSWEDGPEHTCAIARTHSDMVKFSRQDHEYDKSRERLRGLARRALMAQHRKRSAGAKFVVPYIKNPDYVDRSATWEKLKMQLGLDQRQGAADTRQRVSLFGLGGVGKTQIALAYVYWLREEFPDVSVFWVHASTEERFRQSYASIAEECDIPGRNDTKLDLLMLVKAWLEKKLKAQWLMVIDNADDAQLFFPRQQNTAHRPNEKLGRYIPECAHGSILVTTRNKLAGSRFAQGRPPIEVGNMTSDESSQLMRNILENDDIRDDEISGLATRLENLPLALAQAAAFIQENTISISRYIRLLDESNVALVDRLSEPFETVGRDSDTPHAVTATWIISFKQIEKQDRFTGEILSLISLFDRQAIPREFITYYWQRKTVSEVDKPIQEARVTKALGTLKAFCFVSEAKDESLDMHRLVQLVARKWLTIKGKMAEFAQQALKTVSSAFPYGDFETREVCLKYLPHAFAVLKNADTASKAGKKARARLLHNMAGYFDYKGHWEEAKQYGIGAVKLRIEILGEEHPDTLTCMGNLVTIYLNQGRLKEAEELGVDVMKITKRVLGEEHPDTLMSMNNLASTYRKQGRLQEAEELDVDVMKITKRVLGEEHPHTLTSMANLASTYRKQGRLKEAGELDVDVMKITKRVLGEEHPDTLMSMNNLASTYRKQGRLQEAEELDVDVMKITKRVLGEEHPHTLTSMANLAATYRNQERLKEAEELEVDVMEIRKRVLGEEHPDTLTSMGNLASTYSQQGRWKDAEELQVIVMEKSKRVLREEHPSTLTSMGNLASTYLNQGCLKEAEELQVDVMEIRKRVLGEEHPSTLTSMGNLAATYWKQGRLKEAEELEVDVMEIRKRVLGEEHPSTLTSMANLAATYRNQERLKEAEELEVDVMEIRKRVLGEEHPDTLTSMGNLASTYSQQGRWKDAEELQVIVMEKTRIPSPERSFDEPCQGQALDDTSSASTHVESEATEAGFGSDAEVSSTSPSLRCFSHKSSQMHKTMQSKDGDTGSEGSSNEDALDGLGSQHREESSSSLPDVEDSGSEDDGLDDVRHGRKRPKASKPSSCTATSSQSPELRGPTAQAQQLQTSTQTSGHHIRSPTPSRETPIPPVAELFAQFEEWPLGGAVLKRITEGSKTTFQLQFEWDPTSCQPHGDSSMSRLKRKRLPDISHLLSKSWTRSRPWADNSLSTSDTIYVADSGVDAPSSDDNLSNGSDSEYNSDRDIVKEARYQTFRRKKVQRRRWTMEDEDLLWQLKQDKLSDSEIATILKRTESGVKQHWDIIERAQRYEKTKGA
ncbi:hypothetical protein AU210_016206 [Fusarium oxysporum f. sp. radicis-cucumerinum]|uniref:NB-ARC domain-containing protein n=1 Tax=Fusarium oxysporum f. sp. radicis-cucumerinum TaxID=327505 RepID=A0A2H3G653_FUSOX|nr:hypothetical protein AU210_016206 [Fusarium oxysporum f. sp. radicis-cucumerinum]